MTDPRILAMLDGWETDCGCAACVERGGRAVAALDAYDDAHPIEALAAYRERVERDVRARVAAEIQAACVTLGCNAAPCTCDAAARIARGDA